MKTVCMIYVTLSILSWFIYSHALLLLSILILILLWIRGLKCLSFMGSQRKLLSLLTTTLMLSLEIWKCNNICFRWGWNWKNNNLVAIIHTRTSSCHLIYLLLSVLSISKFVCDIPFWEWVFFKSLILRNNAETIWSKRSCNMARILYYKCIGLIWCRTVVLERLNKFVWWLFLFCKNFLRSRVIRAHRDHACIGISLTWKCLNNNSWLLFVCK